MESASINVSLCYSHVRSLTNESNKNIPVLLYQVLDLWGILFLGIVLYSVAQGG